MWTMLELPPTYLYEATIATRIQHWVRHLRWTWQSVLDASKHAALYSATGYLLVDSRLEQCAEYKMG